MIVVKNAGHEMVQKQTGGDPMSAMLGNAAIDLFTKPMAQIDRAEMIRLMVCIPISRRVASLRFRISLNIFSSRKTLRRSRKS